MDEKDNVNVDNHIAINDYSNLSPRNRLERCSETVKTVLTKWQWQYNVTDYGMSILYRIPSITKLGYDSAFVIDVMEDPATCQLDIRLPTKLPAEKILRLLNYVNINQNRTLGSLTYYDGYLSCAFQFITKHGFHEDDLNRAVKELLIWSRDVADRIKWLEE